ncbi:PaaI family thioesterase [Streptomyces sp. NBC_01262]|uniref:PaaI family thioesterase n=1 Tax=Streptomyces sp. NBC_01262 TaxID=2903803 RepID=UPI002E35A053|nr:PaaI family thioesterase [Streptomyces sp. NBC_01262]
MIRPTAGQAGQSAPLESEELHRRRTAVTALGHELRDLADAGVTTTAPSETLHQVADAARRLAERLAGPRRPRAVVPDVDEFAAGLRFYNPVVGAGNPLAPPMRIETTATTVTGHCALGPLHEGPPGYAHGGMSAMLLDEVMGQACLHAGQPSMTVALTIRYLRPLALGTPVRVRARITRTEDRKIVVHGSIATEAEPDRLLVEADGTFVTPDPHRTRTLFPHLPQPG